MAFVRTAEVLGKLFPQTPTARHLDYGGGNGMLANILRARGWDSRSYDPFLERDQAHESRGQFDLITAFEVFEHVPDVNALIRDLDGVLASRLSLNCVSFSDNFHAFFRTVPTWAQHLIRVS